MKVGIFKRILPIPRSDYHDTFAPVAKMDSIRLVLAIAASKHWEVHHMDVKSVFLHGNLQEEIYMMKP